MKRESCFEALAIFEEIEIRNKAIENLKGIGNNGIRLESIVNFGYTRPDTIIITDSDREFLEQIVRMLIEYHESKIATLLKLVESL